MSIISAKASAAAR